MPFAFEIREMPILKPPAIYKNLLHLDIIIPILYYHLLQQICGRLAFPIAQICTDYTYCTLYLICTR